MILFALTSHSFGGDALARKRNPVILHGKVTNLKPKPSPSGQQSKSTTRALRAEVTTECDGKRIVASVAPDGTFALDVPTGCRFTLNFMGDPNGDGIFEKFEGTANGVASAENEDLGSLNLSEAPDLPPPTLDPGIALIDTDGDDIPDAIDTDGDGFVDTDEPEEAEENNDEYAEDQENLNDNDNIPETEEYPDDNSTMDSSVSDEAEEYPYDEAMPSQTLKPSFRQEFSPCLFLQPQNSQCRRLR